MLGSSELRAGFSSNESDSPMYTCENIVSRFRDRKRSANMVLCGTDCYADAQSRGNIKSPFDGNVVCGFDTMEYMLDNTFSKLGIDTDRVDHPLLLTEPLCLSLIHI